MEYLIIALRLIHIVFGVFWVGAAFLMNFFIGPTMRATGDAGRQFAGHFMGKTKFSTVMNVSVFATLIAGFILYGIDSSWFTSAWASSGAGIGFSIGATFAILGFITGFMNGNNNRKLAMLGSQIQGKPTPEQSNAIQQVVKQQAWVVPTNTATLLFAIIFMAASRYLIF